MYGKKLEQFKSFKYIGVILTYNANSKNGIAIIIATYIMVILEMICRRRELSF